MARKILKKLMAHVLAIASAATLCLGSGTFGSADVVQAASSISGVSTVSNMPEGFIKGVDISAVIALEKSGASFFLFGWNLGRYL